MRNVTAVTFCLLLAGAATPALAKDAHHMAGQKTVAKSVTGEVVDMGCYLGHAARGEEHASCATKCLSQGMPMGLLTSNGTLYLLTLAHDNADPYNDLKTMAGKQVTVSGELQARNGLKAITANTVKAAKP